MPALLPLRPWSGLALLAIAGLSSPLAATAEGLAVPVPLQCRLADGPWRPCLMQVERMGLAWQLKLNGEQISFSHDGRGNVRMRRERQDWVPVQARWSPDAALCWDGVCAKGELPLD